MKRIINILTLLSAGVTSILILCTIFTSYQFFYFGQMFYSYLPIQIGVSITMIFIAIRFWLNEHGSRKFVYTGLSLAITLMLLVSISFVK